MKAEDKLFLIKREIEMFQEDSECNIADFETLFWECSESEKTNALHRIIKLALEKDEN